MVERLPDGRGHVVRVRGLDDVRRCARCQCSVDVARLVIARQHDRAQVLDRRARLTQNGEAVRLPGQGVDLECQQLRTELLNECDRLRAGGGLGNDSEAHSFEHDFYCVEPDRMRIQQDCLHGCL